MDIWSSCPPCTQEVTGSNPIFRSYPEFSRVILLRMQSTTGNIIIQETEFWKSLDFAKFVFWSFLLYKCLPNFRNLWTWILERETILYSGTLWSTIILFVYVAVLWDLKSLEFSIPRHKRSFNSNIFEILKYAEREGG